MFYKKRSGKFNAKQTTVDGHIFPSKMEADYYLKLKALHQAGAVKYFLQQVPIKLSDRLKMVVDFLVFYADGRHQYVEIKGFETVQYRNKKKILNELYPDIELCVLKRGDF